MYSGSDSAESQNYTQWALNPSAYQNVSNDQVDWAALAQQWIIMKEAGPPVPEQTVASGAQQKLKQRPKEVREEGEAPMDVENEKEETTGHDNGNSAVSSGEPWNWNQQQPWGWGNSWNGPPGVPPPGTVKAPLLPTPPTYNQFGTSHETVADGPNFNAGYNSTPSSEYSSGYWTASGSSKIKPHNKRYSKVNVPVQAPVVHEPVALDAAKRKQLPAWIREGLEKMERDKLKQIERERENQQEKEERPGKLKFTEKDALEIIKSTVKERQKSKFESEGEESEDSEIRGKTLTPEPVPLTQEELMLKVRRTMTEILLKVTNREIYQICKEELQRHLKKSKASDHRVPASSGNNISAKLGLGMYGGDSGSSSEDSEGENRRDYRDSDSELKDAIKRRKAEFSKTEKEIEDRLAEAEHNARVGSSRASSPEHIDSESQVDAKLQANKRRFSSPNEKTPPPKSVSQTSRRKSQKSSSSSDDSDSDQYKNSKDHKKSYSRRSISSESSQSDYRKRDSRDSNKKIKDGKSKSSDSRNSRSRKSRSSSRRRSTISKSRRDSSNSRHSKRSRSRSYSRSKRSRSSNRSGSTRSYNKSVKLRKSRSSSRSRRSVSRNRRSRSRSSYGRSKRRSRSRSNSSNRRSYRYRSRSSSSGRGKRSRRH